MSILHNHIFGINEEFPEKFGTISTPEENVLKEFILFWLFPDPNSLTDGRAGSDFLQVWQRLDTKNGALLQHCSALLIPGIDGIH